MKLIVVGLLLMACTAKRPQRPAEPHIIFTITEGILHPESVKYSARHNAIFISNVASGNPLETKKVSYISKLSPDGKVVKSKWITGLKAPKGIAIVEDFLFVSDVNRVIKIDIKAGKIVKRIPIPKSKFLNDLVADANGNIYISDMFDDVIYILNGGGISEWKRGTSLRSPNGLHTDGKTHLFIAMWGSEIDTKTFLTKKPGTLGMISFGDPEKVEVVESISGHLDGIDSDGSGRLWISDWMSGSIYAMDKNGKTVEMFNFGQGTADISVAKELGLLLIPQMNKNMVIAVKLP